MSDLAIQDKLGWRVLVMRGPGCNRAELSVENTVFPGENTNLSDKYTDLSGKNMNLQAKILICQATRLICENKILVFQAKHYFSRQK